MLGGSLLVSFEIHNMLSNVAVSLAITVYRYLHKSIGTKNYSLEFLSI